MEEIEALLNKYLPNWHELLVQVRNANMLCPFRECPFYDALREYLEKKACLGEPISFTVETRRGHRLICRARLLAVMPNIDKVVAHGREFVDAAVMVFEAEIENARIHAIVVASLSFELEHNEGKTTLSVKPREVVRCSILNFLEAKREELLRQKLQQMQHTTPKTSVLHV